MFSILKNLRFKILALVFAAIFWVFVVSMENTFYKLPDAVPVHVFNQAEDLALASEIGSVSLMLRADETVALKTLSAGDFEAYIDLKVRGRVCVMFLFLLLQKSERQCFKN